jgi:hypothetical protein
MEYDLYKFSKEYPAKFNKPGHNLPMMIFLDTINHPDWIEPSNNPTWPNRLVYKSSDGSDRQYTVVVSATTSANQRCAKIVSGYFHTF